MGFFRGALLKDPKKLLVQLGQVQAARVMKFTSAKDIATKAATIKAYVRAAVAAEKAGKKVETKPREFVLPEELKQKFRKDPKFKRAFARIMCAVGNPFRSGANAFLADVTSRLCRPKGLFHLLRQSGRPQRFCVCCCH